MLKCFAYSSECTTFALTKRLGYGVMVTLQILVLPFLVRVRVAQQGTIELMLGRFFFVPFSLLCSL